jgi:hypothetical protein
MAWVPVTFLAAYSFYKWEHRQLDYKKYVGIITAILGGIISLLLIAVAFIGLNVKKLAPYVEDTFARGNMEAEVHWSGWEGLVGLLLVITIVAGLMNLRNRAFERAAWIFFTGTALVIFLASAVIVPKVERYSQGAAIDFFIQRQGEDCYVHTLGYKSYGDLFYTQKERPANPNSYSEEWLLTGNIDKPVYFVTKVDREDKYKFPELKELYRKNGFVFLKRELPVHQ